MTPSEPAPSNVVAFPGRTADDVMTKILRENLMSGLAMSCATEALRLYDAGTISADGALDFIRVAVKRANEAVRP